MLLTVKQVDHDWSRVKAYASRHQVTYNSQTYWSDTYKFDQIIHTDDMVKTINNIDWHFTKSLNAYAHWAGNIYIASDLGWVIGKFCHEYEPDRVEEIDNVTAIIHNPIYDER